MKNLVLPRIQAMEPYAPPLDGRSQYKGLLLDFNERTIPAADKVIDALQQFASNAKAQLYPEYFDLGSKIADYAGTDPDEVMLTNGTDQAIDIIVRTFADKSDKVIIPEPTFAMYRQYARVAGCRVISPLNTENSLDFPLTEVLAAINDQVKLIVICNPNNPTGTLLSTKDIARIAGRARGAIVYVDEAYFEFSRCTAVELIKKYPNVIVSRTFSKAFGLAGLRIGYVIADRRYITEMLKVRGPYDVNQLAASAAAAALDNVDNMLAYVKEVMDKAKPLAERFFASRGIRFYPSAGNFILIRPNNPEFVLETLRQEGILVRPQDKPGIEGTLRLTIGTMDQVKVFIKAYETILKPTGQKYALLDRDGTLIYEPPDGQIDSMAKLRVLDGVIDGLRELQALGYKLVMVTNQDGLGSSAFPRAAFQKPHQAMLKLFEESGIEFESILICPHLPGHKCLCRKPGTALLDDFLRGREIDSRQTFVCGDRPSDKRLAKNLGLKYVPMPKNGNFYHAINNLIKGATYEDINR